jgi:CheY-like chemotaxis protein
MANILVVDDHPDEAASLAVLLGINGHDARAASNALSAFSLLTDFTPDVCVLDLRMPWWDGFTLVEKLRRALPRRVRYLAVTADPEAAGDERAAAFEGVFTKPLDVDGLLRAVAADPLP